MSELKQELSNLLDQVSKIKRSINFDEKKGEIIKLNAQTTDPDFWKDKERAKNTLRLISSLQKEVTEVETIEEEIKNLISSFSENEVPKFQEEVKEIEKKIKNLKIKSFLSGKYDFKNAIVSIHAGQGGVEAMDWANILYRMYLRYCERKGFEIDVLEITKGEEAGIKTATFKVNGPYAYGYLKNEAGAHRLVRQSPFNADKLRQTSFALVEVLPELEEEDFPQIKIKDEDLEWQFFRSSSQGGQNVQKVSTAVRLIHKPTGIVVSAQSERFQEQNRKIALNILRSKLWQREEALKEKKIRELKGEYKPASWGYQIRSYILHPYKLVKDLRTDYETTDTEAVLNGEIDQFIEEEIQKLRNSKILDSNT